jgi:hypothetical protein
MSEIFMRNKLFRVILLCVTFSLLFVTTFGCTYFSPIVGKWQDNKSQDTVEFTRDGNVIMESGGYFITGKYELIGDNIVKLSFGGLGGDMLSAFGVDTWQYTISGNTMTIEGAGSTSILYRVRSITSNTSTTNTQTSTTTAINTTTRTTTTLPTKNDAPFVVQSIYVAASTQNEGQYYIWVILEPTSLATLNTNYMVALYENGELRASTTLQYRYIELNILIKNVKFPCSADDYQKYGLQSDISNIFSVVISE